MSNHKTESSDPSLYNSIKTLEGFSDDDTRGESKEEDNRPSDEA